MSVVLQKYIADSGYCSRRQAEELIRNGKVVVNGKKAELGMRAEEKDIVKIGNKIIKAKQEKIYIIINKPTGYVCTNRKFKDEKNVFDLLVDKKGRKTDLKQRLFAVGRLDKDSQGLLLLTNDGELAQKISHPRFGHEKIYEVKARSKKLEVRNIVDTFKNGVDIGEGDGVVKAKRIEYLGDNKFKIVLAEGKKRQIRRMFRALGCEVQTLTRISIGNIKLGNLKSGEWECLREEEIRKLL